MVDPYLVKNIPCYVWQSSDQEKRWGFEILVFIDYWNNLEEGSFPRFQRLGRDYRIEVSSVYRPIGTEWDFAPEWAICSTVDADGNIQFWNEIPEIWNMDWYDSSGVIDPPTHFLCPERSRYEGNAWRSSMRMRPEWAKVRHLGIEWCSGGA